MRSGAFGGPFGDSFAHRGRPALNGTTHSGADRIRDAYLEPWERYASPVRLRETFDLAQRVAPLTYAITFREEVLPALDPSWELREFVSPRLAGGRGGLPAGLPGAPLARARAR